MPGCQAPRQSLVTNVPGRSAGPFSVFSITISGTAMIAAIWSGGSSSRVKAEAGSGATDVVAGVAGLVTGLDGCDRAYSVTAVTAAPAATATTARMARTIRPRRRRRGGGEYPG